MASVMTNNGSSRFSIGSFASLGFAFLSIALVVWGWGIGLENYISPEFGIGYALGLTGGCMMLIMLMYSLRKRIPVMRRWGNIKYWFQMHMMLGVLGPICILYHCAFSLGSMNSNIALYSMLLVAGSGLVGRYIYRQIHKGLYGEKESLKGLKDKIMSSSSELDALFERFSILKRFVFRMDDLMDQPPLLTSIFLLMKNSFTTRIAYYQGSKALHRAIIIVSNKEGWSKKKKQQYFVQTKNLLLNYYRTYRKVNGFHVYERLFSIWHVLHIPLFIMMILTGFVHVYAVHVY
ncbi:MAG: hypothetical protein JKY51_07025 [Opitutaceae bacterium]|nr:hypothetical protein [Opitutaceae bacterium]